MSLVLANGCFDILHVGHVWHLEEARKMGARLVVSLTLDDHVNKGPGRPVYTWNERAAVLRALRCVDEVVPSRNAWEAIESVRPNVFVKGIDYADHGLLPERQACALVGAEIRFTRSPKLSASETIKKVSQL